MILSYRQIRSPARKAPNPRSSPRLCMLNGSEVALEAGEQIALDSPRRRGVDDDASGVLSST